MKKKKLKGILIFVAVFLIFGSFHVSSYASEIDKAKEKKSDLEKKKEETETRIAELEKEKEDIISYIEELDKEMNRLQGEIDTTNADIETAETELEAAQEELEAARIAEENQYTIMKNRIKYMYENGQADYFEIIMNSDNLADILNQVEYMSKITEYDNSLFDKYNQLKEEVAAKEEAKELKLADLNELKEELTYEQETVERLVADKNEELVKYEERINESQLLAEEYNSKIAEQEEIIDKLIEAERIRQAEEAKKHSGGAYTYTGNFSGNFMWPVPSSARITSTFGGRDQPTAGASTYHKGIDIGAPSGSSVVASASGTVVTATYSVSAGNYIMISHGNDTYTVYMHCSKLFVSPGDEVKQGQEIAAVGSTGVSTGPHLHFGVLINGNYVNPLDYVGH